VADRTRAVNRLCAQLLHHFTALQRAIDYSHTLRGIYGRAAAVPAVSPDTKTVDILVITCRPRRARPKGPGAVITSIVVQPGTQCGAQRDLGAHRSSTIPAGLGHRLSEACAVQVVSRCSV